jgi:Uma2 family endonuclease
MREDHLDLADLAFPLILRPDAPMTDEELIRFSERNRLYKIERNKHGDITIMTPLGGLGGTHEIYVSFQFMSWSEQNGHGVPFSPSTGFNLPDGSTLSPDVAWLPLAKWNSLTREQQKRFLPFCPEFLIEVCSESDPRRIVEAKMPTWIENGAKLAWLVDPIDTSVTIYGPGKDPVTLDRPVVVTATDPVAGFSLPCNRLWSE